MKDGHSKTRPKIRLCTDKGRKEVTTKEWAYCDSSLSGEKGRSTYINIVARCDRGLGEYRRPLKSFLFVNRCIRTVWHFESFLRVQEGIRTSIRGTTGGRRAYLGRVQNPLDAGERLIGFSITFKHLQLLLNDNLNLP